MCILCSLLGFGSSGPARSPVFAAGPGSSASMMIGDGAPGPGAPAVGSTMVGGGASGAATAGTTGPGAPAIAAGAYDHTGNVFLDVLVGWGWLDVGGDRNITYYFDQTSPYHQWTNFEMGV